jgi:hypothetical protein
MAGHFSAAAERRFRRDDHSSSPVIAEGVKQPTRKLRTGRPRTLPYLVLLRAGFCLPPTLRPARCALTAPFHPYPPPREARSRAVYFLCHCPSGHPDRALPGALPFGVRTFLPSSRPFGNDDGRSSGSLRRDDSIRAARTGRAGRAGKAGWRQPSESSPEFESGIAFPPCLPCPACPCVYPSVSCEIWYCSSFL